MRASRPENSDRLNAMLPLLADVVNIDSGSEDTEGVLLVQERFAGELAALGFDVRYFEGSRYAPTLYAQLGSQDRTIVLMGHADTVFPVGTSQARPFCTDDLMERAFGPGAFDMKAGLVVMLFAIRELLTRTEGCLPYGLRILINGDEEPGSPESRRHLKSALEGATCALILEPPDIGERLVVSRKGVGVFHLSAQGVAAHAGDGQSNGGNAIHALLEALARVADLADEEVGTSVNIGIVRGGEDPSIIAASASAAVDVRVVTPDEARRVERGLMETVRSASIPHTRVTIDGRFHRPPMAPLAGTESLQGVVAAVGDALGIPVLFSEKPEGGASDANLIASFGIPCIDGMGALGGGAHTDREWVDLVSMMDRTDLLVGVLAALAQENVA